MQQLTGPRGRRTEQADPRRDSPSSFDEKATISFSEAVIYRRRRLVLSFFPVRAGSFAGRTKL